jgi:hypothetical protein
VCHNLESISLGWNVRSPRSQSSKRIFKNCEETEKLEGNLAIGHVKAGAGKEF